MARTTATALAPTQFHDPHACRYSSCPECGQLLWVTESKHRTITTLNGVTRLNLAPSPLPQP